MKNNETRLRILGDHFAKGRRIGFDLILNLESLLETPEKSNDEKVEIIKTLISKSKQKLNIQQREYNLVKDNK